MKTRVDQVNAAEVRGHTFAVHTAGSDDPAQHDFIIDGEHDRVRLGGYGQWLHVLDMVTLRVGEPSRLSPAWRSRGPSSL